MSNFNYDYSLSGVETNENFERINALLVWADENGRYSSYNDAILARPVNEEVTQWDGVDKDCLAIRCDHPSMLWKSEHYAYVQIKVTGRVDRRIPSYGDLYGRKVKVTFQDGDVRDGFVVNFVNEEN